MQRAPISADGDAAGGWTAPRAKARPPSSGGRRTTRGRGEAVTRPDTSTPLTPPAHRQQSSRPPGSETTKESAARRAQLGYSGDRCERSVHDCVAGSRRWRNRWVVGRSGSPVHRSRSRVAMVTVGVVAPWPFAALMFLAMAVGGAFGIAGVSAPGAEVAIAAVGRRSCLVLMPVLASVRLSHWTAGLAHGHARAGPSAYTLIYIAGYVRLFRCPMQGWASHVVGHRPRASPLALVLGAGAGLTLGIIWSR